MVTKPVTSIDHGRYCVHLYAAVLPAAVADVGLHADTTAYVF